MTIYDELLMLLQDSNKEEVLEIKDKILPMFEQRLLEIECDE
jgi:hypothetical protein